VFDGTPMIKAKLSVREVIPELVRYPQRKTGPRSAGRNATSTETTAGTAFAVPPDGKSRECILLTAKAAESSGLKQATPAFGC
jgi:hypothetical protein